MVSTPLTALSFLTQKIIHSKTGHVFLLYCWLQDETTVRVDLTIAGPSNAESQDFDTQLLGRWWSNAWSEEELTTIVAVDTLVENIVKGELLVRGWSGKKARKDELELKLVVDPKSEERAMLALPECSATEAFLQQKLLLNGMTEKAQTQSCRVFPETALGVREDLAELQAEVSSANRQLKKRDRVIEELKVQLETANEQLKEYVREAAPARPTNPQPRIPANHSKAAVTKKRRLVQKVEYED
ncbi:hypothetical protein FRB90_007769 [Tulasnella sp. 427]|nr:hypothetical protein FRB90_007769 [Tulasnella sp. 427]